MALNKKQTPVWVKGVIIFVAVSFVIGFIPIVVAGLGSSSGSKAGNTGDPTSATSIAATYQPTLDALNASLQADPENVGIMSQLGHASYAYAAELSNSGQSAAAAPLWATAISFYDRVLAKEPTNAVVLGNKAFASVYSNSAGAQSALEAFIATNEPSLASQIETAKGMLETVKAAGSTGTTTTP
jgi:tetratricopeptide (TPR) repeat protein